MPRLLRLLCFVGIHRRDELRWLRCECDRCGAPVHRWNGCKCSRCASARDTQHAWNGCICPVCGKIRDTGHAWDGCVCTKCRRKRDEAHNWAGCVCQRCGSRRNLEHVWAGCTCTKCRAARDSEHAWEGCKCGRCGRERDAEHKWEGCKCSRCGKVRDSEHSWHRLRCTRCGSVKPHADHVWTEDCVCQGCEKSLLEHFSGSIVVGERSLSIGGDAIVLGSGVAAGAGGAVSLGSMARVSMKAEVVEALAKSISAPAWSDAPAILIACRALGRSREVADKLLADTRTYRIQEAEAAKFPSTAHWGSAQVYAVQILSKSLGPRSV